MPEGPEIWRAADELHDALSEKTVNDIHFAFDELQAFREKLMGRKVVAVEPRGKAILTFFDNDLAIYSHNQLYGKWFVVEKGNMPDTNRSLRLAIHNGSHSALLYSASEIEVLNSDEAEEHSYVAKLGPDTVHPETTLEEVRARFGKPEFVNRKLTTLLLDQHFLSGVGNYLRSEILFVAGVYPHNRPKDCTEEELDKLAEAALRLSRRSYETGGFTNDPETVEALKWENVTGRDLRHFVYKRTGNRCYRCGSVIAEEQTGGRKIYYCPECQGGG